VVTRTDSRGNTLLVAHIVAADGAPPSTVELRRFLLEADEAHETLRPLSPSGAYLNFVGDEGRARIRASFGEVNYRRLAKLKARLDPDNLFAVNQNIEPADG
jgi:hypothetical protein